ncbi:uncharacterized protein METZ01_LOCUS56661, partial [marine metagenome]
VSESVIKSFLSGISDVERSIKIWLTDLKVDNRFALTFEFFGLSKGLERCFSTQICLARCELCQDWAAFRIRALI